MLMDTFAAYTGFTMGVIADRRATRRDDLFSIWSTPVEGQQIR